MIPRTTLGRWNYAWKHRLEQWILPWALKSVSRMRGVWVRQDPHRPKELGEITIQWYETGRIDFQFAGLHGRHLTAQEIYQLLASVAQEIERRVSLLQQMPPSVPVSDPVSSNNGSSSHEVMV